LAGRLHRGACHGDRAHRARHRHHHHCARRGWAY
jgi:hypothetical protein